MKTNHYDMSGKNNPNYGKISPNRGKKIEDFMSPESAKKNRERLKNGLFKGSVHSKESKKKIGESQRGDKNHFYGKRLSNEHKNY